MTIRDELDELFTELDKEILPQLEDGDITRKMLAEEKRVSENTIKRIMKKLVKSGEWVEVIKRDKYGPVTTYRKAVHDE